MLLMSKLLMKVYIFIEKEYIKARVLLGEAANIEGHSERSSGEAIVSSYLNMLNRLDGMKSMMNANEAEVISRSI